MNWLIENRQWVFDGFGVAIAAGVIALIGKLWRTKTSRAQSTSSTVAAKTSSQLFGTSTGETRRPADVKASTKILFIDDDTKFKVVKILKNSGWVQTSLVKDVTSLSEAVIVEAFVIFVDIQGVGLGLGFKDEGLGLAAALKDRYPEKRVVIYSAEPKGEMFHKALKKADASLAKNADPYEFERTIEGFVGLA